MPLSSPPSIPPVDSEDHLLLTRYAHTLSARASHSGLRQLTLAAASATDFSSNDFLSLSRSPSLRAAYLAEFAAASANLPLASTGSRLLDGNSAYACALEADVAAFHRGPAGLLFNSGFDANAALFSCLAAATDAVLYDEHIHASVHDGMRLSRAASRCDPFPHNCVAGFEAALRRRWRSMQADLTSDDGHVFVAVESVYSMDGDVAPLHELLAVMDAVLPPGHGHLIVDEAHATGVFGPRGRGLVCALGLEARVFARLHTFGKALACGGAIVLCAPVTRAYLLNYARPLIYTTAPALPTLCMIRCVYTLLASGATEAPQRRLWRRIAQLHTLLRDLPDSPFLPNTTTPGDDAPTSAAPSATPSLSPIFSLPTPHPRALAAHCQARGFTVRAIVPPTVPAGTQRVRVCLHAGDGASDVAALVACVREWVVEREGREQCEGASQRAGERDGAQAEKEMQDPTPPRQQDAAQARGRKLCEAAAGRTGSSAAAQRSKL